MARIAALGIAALVTNAIPAHAQERDHAQESEIAALRAQIQEMRERLDKMEAAQKKQAEAAVGKESTTAKFPLTISGLLLVRAQLPFSENGPALDTPNTFRLRRGELRITAPRITDRISGTILFDAAKTLNSSLRPRDSILHDLMISYLVKKAPAESNNKVYIDFGGFKMPIGYEPLVSSSMLPLVDRSIIFSQRDPFDGGYGDIRDTGIQVRGTQGKIDYRLGVFNGLGDRQNTLSVSDGKAIVGLLSYRANKNLTLGVSGGTGNTGSAVFGKNLSRKLFNLFAAYKRDKLTLQGEYLRGDAAGYLNATTYRKRETDGYYAHVGYFFNPKIEGVLRYNYLNADRQAHGDTTVQETILGLNYYIKGHNAKLQANLVRRQGASALGANSSLANDRTELIVQSQVAF